MNLLRYGIILSFFITVIYLFFLIIRTFSFGKKSLYAESQGDVKKGIIYAFGKGMMPWEKESAKKHLLTYFAGIFYHFGIFSAAFYVISVIIHFYIGALIVNLIRALVFIGILCGIGLLVKRIILPYMRKISTPDDFLANILVDVFLILAFIDSYTLELRNVFLASVIIMLLYIPLGKIRHCFFFFYSRVVFGIFYGRRGVFPQSQSRRY